MAYANEKRDWRIFADFPQVLIQQALTLYSDEPFRVELKMDAYALDSTTTDLCLSLLAKFNQAHAEEREADSRLDARIKSYELAARMQLSAPEALDIAGEPAHIKRLYGLDHNAKSWPKEINEVEEIDYFSRKCLVARRLLEGANRGVGRLTQKLFELADVADCIRDVRRHRDVESS